MLQQYCKIIGVSTNATLDEIKKKYREKAKVLHPDVNKSANAQQDFIELTEAYEYLYNWKTGKIIQPNNRSAAKKYDNYHQWQKEQRQQARARAAFYAKKRYEEFLKSDYYKMLVSFDVIVFHIGFLLSVFVLVGVPLIGCLFFRPYGIWISLGIAIITLPATWPSVSAYKKLQWKQFFNMLTAAFKHYQVSLAFLSVINVVLFMRIGLQTLISLYLLLGIFVQLMFMAYLVTLFLKRHILKAKRMLISFALCPLIINILLLINYIFSSQPFTETYRFSNRHEQANGKIVSSTYITLEQNAYSEFQGIRLFSDIEQMNYKTHVKYKFETGLFGWKVMKDYQFIENH